MAKNKKAKHARQAQPNRGSFKNSPRAQAHAHGRTTSSSLSHRKLLPVQQTSSRGPKPKKAHSQPSQTAAYIPFAPTRRNDILLVGEGDFSFAQSLAVHHRARWNRLIATSYESRQGCLDKYAQAEKAVADITGAADGESAAEAGTTEILFDIDATKLASYKEIRNGKTIPKKKAKDAEKSTRISGPQGATGGNTATLGSRDGNAAEGQGGGWDWIVFNFPHVGGLSTDQRRQVRANQEMLVGFFESASEILRKPGAARSFTQTATHQHPKGHSTASKEADPDRYNTDEEDEENLPNATNPEAEQLDDIDGEEIKAGGRILLTIFDGLPYSLWNVRDLARHAGLSVERSFKFQASAYLGYKHARTLGDIKPKKKLNGTKENVELDDDDNAEEPSEGDGDDDDTEESAERDARIAAGLSRDEVKEEVAKAVGSTLADDSSTRPGAWRGEERPARSYIFTLSSSVSHTQTPKRKRGQEHSDDDSE